MLFIADLCSRVNWCPVNNKFISYFAGPIIYYKRRFFSNYECLGKPAEKEVVKVLW
jgi:hypothetical protein